MQAHDSLDGRSFREMFGLRYSLSEIPGKLETSDRYLFRLELRQIQGKQRLLIALPDVTTVIRSELREPEKGAVDDLAKARLLSSMEQ